MTVPPTDEAGGMRRIVDGVTRLVGIGFIVGGGVKIGDPSRAADFFASWGVPTGLVVPVAGWVEVLIGVALLNRPTRGPAAVVLAGWMLLWGVLQARAASPAALASLVVFVLMALYLRIPRARRRPGEPWVESPLATVPDASSALPRLFRLVGLAFLIRWAVGGVLYWSALPALALAATPSPPRGEARRLESVLLHLLVLGLGVSGIWAFVGHTFMSEAVSQSVGWAPSPFQEELAFYHLAVGVAGLACWWIRDHFWLAAAGIPSLFLYGAGWVHLTEFLEHGNAAPANWGFPVVFGNLVVPTVVLALGLLRARHRRRRLAGPSDVPPDVR